MSDAAELARHEAYPSRLVLDTENTLGNFSAEQSDAMLLIRPRDAVTFIARGDLDERPKIRRWLDFHGYWDLQLTSSIQGGEEVALRLIQGWIQSGKLRVLFITPGLREANQFDPFENIELREVLASSWSTGVKIANASSSHDPNPCYIKAVGVALRTPFSQFFFSWEELEQVAAPLWIDGDTEKDGAERFSEPPQASMPSGQKRRGRRPNAHGGAIAGFLAQMIAEGIDSAVALTDDALGMTLIEHYERLGDYKPSLDNAGRDARAALAAWVGASRAQITSID